MLLVIGYGNSLRSDDGFGPAVIEALRPWCQDHPVVEVMAAHQLLPEHADLLAAAEMIFFVDAALGSAGGCIDYRAVSLEETAETSSALAHSFSPSKLLNLTRTTYGKCPPAFICTAGALNLEVGERLSAAVSAAVPEAVALLQDRLLEVIERMSAEAG